MSGARGSASIVVVAAALVLATMALAAADLGAMVHARARAQTAAEAAALAAVVEQAPVLGQGSDPTGAAREAAAANGAVLVRCSCRVGDASATVEAAIRARPVLVVPWFGRRAYAVATAEVDPDVFSYREAG